MKNLHRIAVLFVMIFSVSLVAVSCTESQIISNETETDVQAQKFEQDNTFSINKDEVEDPNDRGN